ncbi:MAG: phosphatase PAP2 family protein [Bacteroidales bacterium]|nr:phosphatase PAP2 family protein [Bacteroidales bacterium]
MLNFDTQSFLFLNGLHADWLDPIMIFISGKLTWFPFYLVLLFLVIKNYKKQSVLVIISIILLIICSDQISSSVFKPLFERPRPCHNEAIKDLVYLPNGHCGGAYGFISSHACNAFALAVFITQLLKQYYSKIVWVMFVWASLVAYSRIYMGVHYPGDVLVGAVVGAIIGWGVFRVYKSISQKVNKC